MLYNLDEKENVRCFSTELHEDDYQIDFQGGELHGVLVISENKTETQYYTIIPKGSESEWQK